MPPSSDLPQGPKPHSSFCSVDWLAQSSHSGPTHTSRPREVCWRGLTAPAWEPGRGEPSQDPAVDEAKTPDLRVQGTPVTGLSKDSDPLRVPRVRTAFTAAQVSTLESAFKLRQYLGPQERKKLAREMCLTEVQVVPAGWGCHYWALKSKVGVKRKRPRPCPRIVLGAPPPSLGQAGLHTMTQGSG